MIRNFNKLKLYISDSIIIYKNYNFRIEFVYSLSVKKVNLESVHRWIKMIDNIYNNPLLKLPNNLITSWNTIYDTLSFRIYIFVSEYFILHASCKLRKLGEKIFIFRKLLIQAEFEWGGEKICIFLILKDTLIHNLKDSEIYHSLNEFVSYLIFSTSSFRV